MQQRLSDNISLGSSTIIPAIGNNIRTIVLGFLFAPYALLQDKSSEFKTRQFGIKHNGSNRTINPSVLCVRKLRSGETNNNLHQVFLLNDKSEPQVHQSLSVFVRCLVLFQLVL